MDLGGTWHGEYTYGAAYDALAGSSVPFVLSLTQSQPGQFVGYVRDDATKGGQPERGRIRGERRGNTITFVKTMPTGYVADENGSKEATAAWLRRTFGPDAPGAVPHRILYAGTLSADGTTLSGRWQIPARSLASNDDVVHMIGGEGTWTAHRVSDLPSEV